MPKRKKPRKPRYAVALIALLALAACTPTMPEGAASCEVVGGREYPNLIPGVGVFNIRVEACEDGAERTFVNGRLYAYDPNPNDMCTPYWTDQGMLPGGETVPESEWLAPDWQSQVSRLCPQA